MSHFGNTCVSGNSFWHCCTEGDSGTQHPGAWWKVCWGREWFSYWMEHVFPQWAQHGGTREVAFQALLFRLLCYLCISSSENGGSRESSKPDRKTLCPQMASGSVRALPQKTNKQKETKNPPPQRKQQKTKQSYLCL